MAIAAIGEKSDAAGADLCLRERTDCIGGMRAPDQQQRRHFLAKIAARFSKPNNFAPSSRLFLSP